MISRAMLIVLSLLSCVPAYAESGVAIETVAMESANQDSYGQYLVASVIVNRAKVRNMTLEQVCLARRQFSCWDSPRWSKAWLDRFYTPKAQEQAKKALERAIREPYEGITHYHTLDVSPYWAKGHKPVIIEGQHKFYNDIN